MIEGLFQPVHLIIILVLVLIVFGPGKLPGIGGAMGKSIKEFKDSVEGAGDDRGKELGYGAVTRAHTVPGSDPADV